MRWDTNGYFIAGFAIQFGGIGLLGVPALVLPLAIRVVFEEQLLRERLPGYAEYVTRVRFRLIPFVW